MKKDYSMYPRYMVKKVIKMTQNKKTINNCKVLRAIAATTFWEDDQELKILMATCNHLNLHSFRWLCYELGVINKLIHKSDKAFQKYAPINCNPPLCKNLKTNFGCGCRLDCGVLTPLELKLIKTRELEEVNFIQDRGWLYAEPKRNLGTQTQHKKIKLCKSFSVTGIAENEYSEDWGYILYFSSKSNPSPSFMTIERRLVIKTEDLLNKGFISRLNEFGVQVQESQNDQILDLIRTYIFDYNETIQPHSPPSKYTVTHKPGWNNGLYVSPVNKWTIQGDFISGSSFDTPQKPIFYCHPENILNPFVALGTAANWINQSLSIASPQPSSILFEKLLICGISLLPFRLKQHKLPICVFHIWGSNKGHREALLRLSSSIWGRPDKFIYRLDYFEQNLHDICLLHNDSLICLSEISDLVYKQYIKLILKLTYEEIPFKTAEIKTKQVILSSGEKPILIGASQRGKHAPIVINIKLDDVSLKNEYLVAKNSFGCFSSMILQSIYSEPKSTLHPDSQGFHKNFRSSINSNLRKKNKTNIKTIETISLEIFEFSMQTAKMANQPQSYSLFQNRLLECFSQSLENRSKQEKESVANVKRYLEGDGHSRLINGETLCPDIKYENNLDGYFVQFKSRWYALILTDRFDQVFCQACPKKKLAALLCEDKILKPGKKSLSITHWIKGLHKSKRGYLLKLPTLPKPSRVKFSKPANLARFFTASIKK